MDRGSGPSADTAADLTRNPRRLQPSCEGHTSPAQGARALPVDQSGWTERKLVERCAHASVVRLTSDPGRGLVGLRRADAGRGIRIVVEVVDGLPDQQPVGTVSLDLPLANFAGNSVIEDIGGGLYIGYAHLRPGSAAMVAGAENPMRMSANHPEPTSRPGTKCQSLTTRLDILTLPIWRSGGSPTFCAVRSAISSSAPIQFA